MKATLLHATLLLVLGSSTAFANSANQSRCEQCAVRDKKIAELRSENDRLKGSKESSKVTALAEKFSASTYTVRPNDSLEQIARRGGFSLAALGKINGLNASSIIHPGQTLKLPTAATVASAPNAPITSAPSPAATASTYTVKDGDTYTAISKKAGVSVSDLIAANPKAKATSLRTGQIIELRKPSAPTHETMVRSEPTRPVRSSSPPTPAIRTISNPTPLSVPKTTTPEKSETAKPKEEASPAPAPALKTAPALASTPTGNAKTTVRSVIVGDETSYSEFATGHGTTPDRLNELNGLSLSNGTVLAKGSELYIPAQP